MSFSSLTKGITPKIRMLCFVLINNVSFMYLDLITDVTVRANAFMCACVRACMVWRGVGGGYVRSSCVRTCVRVCVRAFT